MSERQSLSHEFAQEGTGTQRGPVLCAAGEHPAPQQGRDVVAARQLPPPDPAWTTASQSRAASEELVSLDPPQCPQPHKTHKLGSVGGHGLWNPASRDWIPASTCETSCESNDLTSLYTISLSIKWR